MNVVEKLRGIIGVINTPFDHENTIDEDSLRNYVNRSIDCGVVGFLALGMASEVQKLTLKEKVFIVKTVVDEVRGRVPVICGVLCDLQSERLLLTNCVTELGCDGVMVNIYYENEDSYIKQITEIAAMNPGFMMIQDWDFKGYGIPIHVIKKLFDEIESFKCLKIEVVPAGVKYSAVRKATNKKLHVSGGWAGTQMIEALDREVDAFMPTVLHDIYVRIFDLYHSGRREEAKNIFYEIVPVLAFSHQHLDISIHFNKKLVHREGLFSTDKVREPIIDFDEYHEKVADELIEKAINQKNSIKNTGAV